MELQIADCRLQIEEVKASIAQKKQRCAELLKIHREFAAHARQTVQAHKTEFIELGAGIAALEELLPKEETNQEVVK